MKKILFVPLIFLIGIHFAFAQAYKWVDDKGAVHFTDDLNQVPEKYRLKLDRIGFPEEKGEAPAEAVGTPKKKEDPYKDHLGRGEDYWKGRVDEWRKKLRALQDRLEGLIKKYNALVERFNDSKSTAERGSLRKDRDQVKAEMDQCRVEVEEARNMLDKKIPEEAELYKAKSEWVK